MAPPLTQHHDHLFLSSLVADAALDLTDEGQFTEDGKVTAAPSAAPLFFELEWRLERIPFLRTCWNLFGGTLWVNTRYFYLTN
jgi:hypothetical protein